MSFRTLWWIDGLNHRKKGKVIVKLLILFKFYLQLVYFDQWLNEIVVVITVG